MKTIPQAIQRENNHLIENVDDDIQSEIAENIESAPATKVSKIERKVCPHLGLTFKSAAKYLT